MLSGSFFLANVATNLMFMYLPYLLYGNLIIGLIEGLLLVVLFKARKRALVLMIVANYLSMSVGLVMFGLHTDDGLVQTIWRPTVLNYQFWIAMAIGMSIVLSILLEWPFCFGSFDRKGRRIVKTIAACTVIQIVSNLICLAPFWGMYAKIDIRNEVAIVDITSIVPDDLPFWVYYIEPADGDIYRMMIDGASVEHVMDADYSEQDQLFVYDEDPTIEPGIRFNLYARPDYRENTAPIIEDFADSESAFRELREYEYASQIYGMTGYAADLREPQDRYWYVMTRAYWGIKAARGNPELDPEDVIYDAEESITLTFTTAFGTWLVRNPSILPGDLFIFEFGGQICALDLNQRKLAFIRFGYGPIVVRDEPVEASVSNQADD